MLKQELGLKQVQKLSPLQIQTIKLIELPIQDLEQRIRKELEENPVLDDETPESKDEDGEEQPREVSLSDIKEDDSIPDYKLRVNNYGKDERPEYNTFSVKESFTQSLMEQLGFRNLSEHQHDIAAFIIGSLDEDGYLRRDIDSLVDDLAFRMNIETTPEEVEKMLRQAALDAKTIVSESETLQRSRMTSAEIIRRAEERTGELYRVANSYTEDALRRTEEAIQMALDEVRQSRTRFRAASNEQMQQIRSGAAAALTEETAENGEK